MNTSLLLPRHFFVVLLAGLGLGLGLSAAGAGTVISESFQFGPEVAHRAEVKTGDGFESGPVQEGESEWKVSNSGKSKKGNSFEYVEGGGISYVPHQDRGNASFRTTLPSEADGKALEAVVEFLPGTLWGKEDRSGIMGLWVGFVDESDPRGLLANIDGANLVLVRFAVSDIGGRALLRLNSSSGSAKKPANSKVFQIDPTVLHRLVLRVDPAAGTVGATLEDAEGSPLAELTDDAPEAGGFSSFKIDLTSLTYDEHALPPVLKKVVITAD